MTISADQYAGARLAIYELLGRRNPLGPMQVVDRHIVPRNAGLINLTGRPVREIVSVTVNGIPVTDFTLFNGFQLQLGAECGCASGTASDLRSFVNWFGPNGGRGGMTQYGVATSSGYPDSRAPMPRCFVDVNYIYGFPPSGVLECAIQALGATLCSTCGCSGDCNCRTPANTTSINRQGVSWQIHEVDAIIKNGARTGIPEVDELLATYNPDRARRRARVFSTSNPPARRLSAVRLPIDTIIP